MTFKPKMPPGIPYIVGNEAAERFSFYGMKTILLVFMTEYLMGADGELDTMSDAEGKYWYHIFVMFTYFFPIFGAIISDIFWGKYRTIIILSIVYCAGHLALALDETRLGLSLGLTMIAIGSGGIKPCVSAHVGDQFTKENETLIERAFSYFYLSINLGAFISSFLTPIFLKTLGPHVAFGIPGILMFIATIVFWVGRNDFISIPPVGWNKYWSDVFSKEGRTALFKLIGIYVFMAVFWSLYDQTGSSWVVQAKSTLMDKQISLFGFSYELTPSQIQAINPVLILILVPIFTFYIYPFLNKKLKLNSVKKISIGFFFAAGAFAIISYIQGQLDAGVEMSVYWQFLAYLVLTMGEILVYGTGLEFSYTQAPNSMKSFIMGFFLLAIAAGNFIAAMVNGFIENPDGSTKLEGADYYWFFTILMGVTAFVFIIVAIFYKEKKFIQDGEENIDETTERI